MRNAGKPPTAAHAADNTKYMIIAASAVVLIIVFICVFSLSSPTVDGPPTIAPVVVAPYRGMVVPLASPDEQDYILRADGTWIPPVVVHAITIQNNVTKSRGFGSVTKNTTGKCMFVNVSFGIPPLVVYFIHAQTGRNNPPTDPVVAIESGVDGRRESWTHRTISFWVLDENYYIVNNVGDNSTKINAWYEWS